MDIAFDFLCIRQQSLGPVGVMSSVAAPSEVGTEQVLGHCLRYDGRTPRDNGPQREGVKVGFTRTSDGMYGSTPRAGRKLCTVQLSPLINRHSYRAPSLSHCLQATPHSKLSVSPW